MQTITEHAEVKITERGSTFLGFLFPCRNESQFAEKLRDIKSTYHDASHHCYAYRVNPLDIEEFNSDDGEPPGTAGLPILNQLKSHELVNTGLVVVRYFGGTKLGKQGLIEAYGGTARHCISGIRLKKIVLCQWFEVVYNYPEQNTIDRLKQNFDLYEREAEYMEQVKVVFGVGEEKTEFFERQLKKIKHLSIRYEKLEPGFLFL